MRNSTKYLFFALVLIGFQSFAQEEEENTKSNIQTYTPSRLLDKGQWDIKFFNNLYTETKGNFNGVTADKPRENYFTSTVEAFTGISDNNRINVGAIVEFRSNTISGRQALSVFSLEDTNTDRKGITSIAPAIKFQPLESVGNFSIQSAIHIPLVSDESDANGVFLDQTAWTFQNRFFYDYTFDSGKWQVFTELNTEYNFGEEKSFANNTFLLVPGAFLSYFPSDESTVLAFVQHAQRFGDFTQNYTALGFGGKYQLSKTLNLEALYSKFVRGENTGLGQSFNIGLRALF
ncbi:MULTISPECIES: transporter [Tenacibaculum]|uniref:transporter n=1 Tax=Tenacibaculum TaxID=104267 RepID=UPI00089AA7BB|nr:MULTISPECIES: transporter [unclassified Tenacibaculum]RBW59279.1 hypothetical protein DS884_05950 [Tenacibaculum sp. E3R01]SEE07803.1 Putative MetA-pathway of phenol degradation [Tenacibaculum sp. MAR_2010_89]